jgi:hypothetical protein
MAITRRDLVIVITTSETPLPKTREFAGYRVTLLRTDPPADITPADSAPIISGIEGQPAVPFTGVPFGRYSIRIETLATDGAPLVGEVRGDLVVGGEGIRPFHAAAGFSVILS